MAHIAGVKISNFENIGQAITFKEFEKQNVLAGIYVAVKKSVAKAIYFGLGASTEQLCVTYYNDLKKISDIDTYVAVTLEKDAQHYVFQRTILSENEQNFMFNNMPIDEDAYEDQLRVLKFDMKKQMLFCDSSNVLCNMLATRPLDLIGTITGLKKQVNAAVKLSRAINELKSTVDCFKKHGSRLINNTQELKDALPEVPEAHAVAFAEYTISNLKREETERIASKAELVTVQAQLDALNADMQNFKETIEREAELRDRKVRENRIMLEQTERPEDVTEAAQECKLVLGIRKMTLQCSLKQVQDRCKMAERLLQELQRLKIESEWNTAFMKGANRTYWKSRMISRENLLKLYPIFHGSEELEADKLELQLILKKGELTKMKNELEIFHFFETVLPQRKMKEMAEPKGIEEILAECNAAVKNVFHPKSFMPNNEELKLKKLRSLIPSNKGFLLDGAFRAIDEQHQCVIENILEDYSSVVVLFKDTTVSMHEMLKREYAEWYLGVTFLVLSELPDPGSREGYVAPTDHWLNHCTFTPTHVDDKSRRKLMFCLGRQLEIYFVESGEDVKAAYLDRKRYAASTDGRFMYARNSFGLDIIRYIKPGEKPTGMEFGAACNRLEDAIRKFNEFTLTFMETENIPRQLPACNTTALEAEVGKLEQELAEKQRLKDDRMQALNSRINDPYEVRDLQNYEVALAEEQHRLGSIDGRITTARDEISRLTTETTDLLAKINGLETYIEVRGKIAVNEQDIGKHNKAIKESEQQITKLNRSAAQLQLKYDNLLQTLKSLKYKTVKTVLQAHQANIDWTTVDCTTEPPTLWQDIQNGIYIDPLVIQINFSDMTDTFNPDVFYVSSRWYAVRDQCQANETEIKDILDAAEPELAQYERRYNNLRADIVTRFMHPSMEFNELLKRIGNEIHPNNDIVYYLQFDFDELINRNSATFTKSIGGDAIGFKCLSKPDRLRTSWLLFAAINEYLDAPFAFINLDQMDDEAATLIYPIIRRMAQKMQLFIDASSTSHSHLANVHYGLNANDGSSDGEPLTKVLRHDGTKFVLDEQVPSANVMDPSANVMDPSANVMDPSANVMDPSANVMDPSANVMDPSANVMDPSTQRDESVNER